MAMKSHSFSKVREEKRGAFARVVFPGDPHIDGDPGDLMFIIRVQK